jgi:hypothetical protein
VAENPDRAGAAEAAVERIAVALDRRRGNPPGPRTSSLKVRDATAEECGRVLADLQARAAAEALGGLNGLLVDFVTVAPRLGLRPVEWCGARCQGEVLVVPCAKATNGRACAAERPIHLGRYGPDFRAAVARLASAIPDLLADYGSWQKLRDAMAERLARACVRTRTRRLSLYSFRHAAIATWKAARLTSAEIAALAGHKNGAMQQRYAGSQHGWDAGDELPQPDAALVVAISARSELLPRTEVRLQPETLITIELTDTALMTEAPFDEHPVLPETAGEDKGWPTPTAAAGPELAAFVLDLNADLGSQLHCFETIEPLPVPRAAAPGATAPLQTAVDRFAGFLFRPALRPHDTVDEGRGTGPYEGPVISTCLDV